MKKQSKPNVPVLFKKWYKLNESRFAYPLVRAPRKKGRKFTFKGVTDNIYFYLNDGGIVVQASYEGNPVDMLGDFDAVLGRKPGKGFYCALCIEPVFYKTSEEFYINECFESLLHWLNTKLAKSKYLYLCFYDGRDGSSWAYLDAEDKRSFWKKLKQIFKMKNSNLEKIRIKVRV